MTTSVRRLYPRIRRHDRVQKACQIIGDVIDVRLVAAGKLPFFAKDFARASGYDQHRRHAARVRHFEVAR